MDLRPLLWASTLSVAATGCNSSVTCGDGTHLERGVCTIDDGGGSDAGRDAGILPADAGQEPDAEPPGDAGTDAAACTLDEVCLPSCPPDVDPDCAGLGCTLDGLCNLRCPPGADPDCDDPCRRDGLCNPACGYDFDCEPTPVCRAPAPRSGDPCEPGERSCTPEAGACGGYCMCARRSDTGANEWYCMEGAGPDCGGSCPSAVPTGTEACEPGARCSFRSEDGLCWTSCACSTVFLHWACNTSCDCPPSEPAVDQPCSLELVSGGRTCAYGVPDPPGPASCTYWECHGDPLIWHATPCTPGGV